MIRCQGSGCRPKRPIFGALASAINHVFLTTTSVSCAGPAHRYQGRRATIERKTNRSTGWRSSLALPGGRLLLDGGAVLVSAAQRLRDLEDTVFPVRIFREPATAVRGLLSKIAILRTSSSPHCAQLETRLKINVAFCRVDPASRPSNISRCRVAKISGGLVLLTLRNDVGCPTSTASRREIKCHACTETW